MRQNAGPARCTFQSSSIVGDREITGRKVTADTRNEDIADLLPEAESVLSKGWKVHYIARHQSLLCPEAKKSRNWMDTGLHSSVFFSSPPVYQAKQQS